MATTIKNITEVIAYYRTSSLTNVEGDSAERQRRAVSHYAASAGMKVVVEFYDAAVSGADPIDQRPGFTDLLAWADENGVRTIVFESANRFARDLVVQEVGYQTLTARGFTLIAADDPDSFVANTPTSTMIRQILGAVGEFEKASTVARLKGARDRASTAAGKRIEGRKGYDQTNPEMVREAKRLARRSPKTGKVRSLREIADELAKLGFVTGTGKPFSAGQVQRLLTYDHPAKEAS